MNIRLTEAELYVLALAIEEDVETDQASVDDVAWAEGIRSLVARFLARKTNDLGRYVFDAELETMARALFHSGGFVALLTEDENGEAVVVSAVTYGHQACVLSPVVEGVWDFTEVDFEALSDAACNLASSVGPVAVEVLASDEHVASHQLSATSGVLSLDDVAGVSREAVVSSLTDALLHDLSVK